MATATLRGDRHRMNIGGIVFENGVPKEVSPDMAAQLADHRHFHVRFSPAERRVPPPRQQTKALTEGQQLRKIRDAVDDLDEDAEDNWTIDGKPSAQALSREVGFTVTNEMRDAALNMRPSPPALNSDGQPKRGKITIVRKPKAPTTVTPQAQPLDTGAAAADDAEAQDDEQPVEDIEPEPDTGGEQPDPNEPAVIV